MKKTLFLSAILGAALCSSAFAETITVDGKTYNDVTIVTTVLDAAPTTDYILIGGTTHTTDNQPNYKVTPDSQDKTKITGAWVKSLTSEQTLIIAPASTVVSEGSPVNYAGYQTFFDSSSGVAQTVNANIIVGGNDSTNLLRFWGGNSFTLAGNLTLIANGVNVWNQAGTHYLTGKIIASKGQTLKQVNGSGGTLNLANADLSQFNGTVNVAGGYVKLGSDLASMELANGTTALFSGGKVTTGSHLVLTQGDATYGNMNILADGAERITAAKGGNRLTLVAGSEKTFASMATTGSNGEWLVVKDVGDTEHGIYTDIILNSTNNGLIIGTSGTISHIGSLSGTAASAQVRGDWETYGTDRVLAVHQNTNTTFAGKFIEKATNDGRDVALVKYGTGTLTLTGANATHKTLTLNEGGVTFSGAGAWSNGDITVNGGTLTLNTTGSFKNIVNNGAVAVTGVAHGEVVPGRTENGYNTTHDIATIAGTGTLSGTGTWTVNGATATLRGDRTLEADVLDTSKYYVDKTDATYASSLKTKYVVAEGKTLTVKATGNNAKDVQVLTNNGTLSINGMTGYFAQNTNLGDVEITGSGLTINNGYSVNSGTQIKNLTGEGTITLANSYSAKDRFIVSGTVADTVDFVNNRKNEGFTTFVFSEAKSIGDVSSTNAGVLNFEAPSVTAQSLTLSSGTIGVYKNGSFKTSDRTYSTDDVATLTTSVLDVKGNATINADLVMSSGTMTFADGVALTMGGGVTIGDTVTVVLTQDMVDAIAAGGRVEIFSSVDSQAALSNSLTFIGAQGVTLAGPSSAYTLVQDGTSVYIAPEPATATLSLLALAALAARRKRH